MSPLDLLSPDQRAVVQLLLKQGKSYDELAGLLRIDARAVRDRAVAALEALGPRDGTPPAPERRAEIADYLLGQQSASQRASTRSYLEGSASGRAWGRVVAGELRPVAGDALPEIPAEGAEVEEAFGALQARTRRRAEVEHSSRLGGALLLAGIGIVLAVVLVVLLKSGGSSSSSSDSSTVADTAPPATSTAGTSTTPTTSTGPTITGQVNLVAPGGGQGSKILGVANVLAQGSQRAVAIQAQGLPPSSSKAAYAVWLTTPGVRRLGFAPPVGKNGRLQAVSGLPADARKYTRLIITRERVNSPTKPGQIVLSGPIQLG